jgi:hypothetical protein
MEINMNKRTTIRDFEYELQYERDGQEIRDQISKIERKRQREQARRQKQNERDYF